MKPSKFSLKYNQKDYSEISFGVIKKVILFKPIAFKPLKAKIRSIYEVRIENIHITYKLLPKLQFVKVAWSNI